MWLNECGKSWFKDKRNPLFLKKYWFNKMSTGTSTSGPITVAKATPLWSSKNKPLDKLIKNTVLVI